MSPRLHIAENLWLEPRDLISHVHGIGLSRTGKSKLIELIVRDFITKNIPFCLIDPHGTLYNAILDWLVVMDFDRPITLFDPSRGTTGFNPFKANYTDESQVMTKAERLLSATLMAWNVSDPSTVPRLTKILTCIYYLIVEQQLSVQTFDVFLDYNRSRERRAILSKTKSEWVRRELDRLYEMPRTAYESYIESTGNRLRMFVHPQVRRILSGDGIDIERIVNTGGMLLVNLQASPDNTIGSESNRVLGTLLVNEFWEVTYKRQKPKEFYLVIDECHRYMTPDIASMLAEGAKYGLHLMLFHQDRSQVKAFEGALKNAQTKLFFSTEESPLPQRMFTLRRADHTTAYAEALPVKQFIVASEEREALIAKLAPTPPAPEPIELESPPMTPIEYSTDPAELLQEFKYLTANQLALLTGDPSPAFKNARNAMLKVRHDPAKLDGRNVYCFHESGKKHENIRHELGITNVHIALYQAGILERWIQNGLKEYGNADAFFTANGLNFFLEYQQTNPPEPLIEKARRYDELAMRHGHHDLCDTFRVLFVLQTPQKAENLRTALGNLTNPCRFWTTDIEAIKHPTEPIFLCGKHTNPHTISVPTGTPVLA